MELITHTNEQLATWIAGEWAKDYFKFDDIQAEFKVLSSLRTDNSLCLQCSFVADETKKGNDSEDLVMFRYDPENYDGFFPSQFQIVTLEIKYTWSDNLGCDALASGYSEDMSLQGVDYVGWDDPKLSDEVVEILLSGCDQYAAAETLINLYDAEAKMPDFVPDRLKLQFSQLVKDLSK